MLVILYAFCARVFVCESDSRQQPGVKCLSKEKGDEITLARRTYATCVTHQFGSVPIYGLGRRSASFFVLIIPNCAFWI